MFSRSELIKSRALFCGCVLALMFSVHHLDAATSSNDFFANRLRIDLPFYHFEGNISGATNEPGEPLPASNKRLTLWWDFIAPEDGLLQLKAIAQFTPTLTLYLGSGLGSIIPTGAVEGTSYQVAGGQAYALQLATDVVPGGDFTLEGRFYSARYDKFSTSQRF